MKILVFGGSFDPIHKGHLSIAENAKNDFGFDEVWFVPCTVSRLDKELTNYVDRINMIATAIEGNPKFRVDVAEADSGAKGRMFTLATHLKHTYPEHEFEFLIGSDSLDNINSWYQYQELTERFKFVIIPRNEGSISSTKAREDIRLKGESDLLTKGTNAYIKEKHLYEPIIN